MRLRYEVIRRVARVFGVHVSGAYCWCRRDA
jgi:uncharacterized protein involved in copper resistance